jgi:hypothetical protein
MGFEAITGPNWIVPTPPAGNSSNQVADTAFVANAVASGLATTLASAIASALLGTTGFVLQTQYTETTTFLAFTTTMAGVLDSIPVKTDGTQILSVSITPNATANTLLVQALAPVTNSAVNAMWVALFQDTTTSALVAQNFFVAVANGVVPAGLTFRLTAGTTGPTTFKINVGNFTGVTTTWALNGIANPATRRLGGASRATLTVQETKV